MITFISGGADSLKLIDAFRTLLYDNQIAVIANTSDCIWADGNLICPDLDDILYLFSGNLNRSGWTGITGDTYSTYNMLEKMAGVSAYQTGEKARAVSIARSNLLREGRSLTETTEFISRFFKITSGIFPATDNRYCAYAEINGETYLVSDFRKIFHDDYAAEFKASVNLDFKKIPVVSERAKKILEDCDAVVIGPGRINTTLLPVFACRGIRGLLKKSFVISVIPKLPDGCPPEKYPAYCRMLEIYRSFSDVIIQDIKEETDIPGAVRLNTGLGSRHSAESLAWEIMSVIRSRGNKTV